MLQKCANPGCESRFHSLREGKLFLAQIHTPDSDIHAVHREHFWLCDICSTQFTLQFDPAQGMVTVPLAGTETRSGASAD